MGSKRLSTSMHRRRSACAAASVLALWAPSAALAAAAAPEVMNPKPSAADWQRIGQLPDFSGVWTPGVSDQMAQERSNPPPWKPEIKRHIDHMYEEERQGRPFLVLGHCLPHGMPAYTMINHNALEILYSPGRVTILGEGDGNRLRRIYTDGRSHPEDPDLSMHGHSIGRWEGETLVVDTVGVVPQAYIAVNEAVGVPNGGDMRIVERIHLAGPDELHVDMELTAPKVLTGTWKTTRKYFRQRSRKYDILEGQCVQGMLEEGTDANGLPIYKQLPVSPDGSIGGRAQ